MNGPATPTRVSLEPGTQFGGQMATKKTFHLTRGGWALLLLSVLIALGAFNATLNLTYLLASLLLAIFLVALVMPFVNIRGIVCRRALGHPPHAGEPFETALRLYNKRRTAARVISVEEPLAEPRGRVQRKLAMIIPPGGRVRMECRLPPMPRGVHPIPALRWSTRFPFGVAEIICRAKKKAELVVYPARGKLSAWVTAAIRPQGVRTGAPARHGVTSSDFRSIREFRPGDNPRHIHWRVSARQDKLCVREMERERSAPVVILLDARLPASLDKPRRRAAREALETAISFAGELSRYALAQGCGLTLIGFFPEPRSLAVTPDRHALGRIYEALARLKPSDAATADALLAPLRRCRLGAADRVVAISPIHATAETLRALLQGIRTQYYVADDPAFATIFAVAVRQQGLRS